MIPGIPGIRASGGSQKGEKGEFGMKGKIKKFCFRILLCNHRNVLIRSRRSRYSRFEG